MIEAPDVTSTRPYLIRALYEWCTDNGFTPYIAVAVDESVQVPREYVKDGEIVLNVSFDATSALKLGNEFIEFKARFAGTPRDLMVPVTQVLAIFARENGQGMAFPRTSHKASNLLEPGTALAVSAEAKSERSSVPDSERRLVALSSVDVPQDKTDGQEPPEPPRNPPIGSRPSLKRVK
ncbi:MAG: ClpXP protease specificity-enhancing factor [Betaproteobacteria bacterium]|jgi:stringent starvation protein B